jgi:hypothetical protein
VSLRSGKRTVWGRLALLRMGLKEDDRDHNG